MRIYAFLAINALLLLFAFAALSFALLRYRSAWQATSREADRLRGKLVDYPETRFYQAANEALHEPVSKEVRVVFLGDSITQRWNFSQALIPYEVINRGIGRQTTSEMLVRIRPDAIELSPAALVILGGTNDFAPQGGPLSLRTTQNNIRSMVELARLHGIVVVIGTIPPICTEQLPPDPRCKLPFSRARCLTAGCGPIVTGRRAASLTSTPPCGTVPRASTSSMPTIPTI